MPLLWTAAVSDTRFFYGRTVARFLTLDDVTAELTVSRAQAHAHVRSGALPAIKVGGSSQWRVEQTKLADDITAAYRDTAAGTACQPKREVRPP